MRCSMRRCSPSGYLGHVLDRVTGVEEIAVSKTKWKSHPDVASCIEVAIIASPGANKEAMCVQRGEEASA